MGDNDATGAASRLPGHRVPIPAYSSSDWRIFSASSARANGFWR